MSGTNIGHHIRGGHRDASTGRTQPVHNPATGETTCHVLLAAAADMAAAVQAASDAFPNWADTPPLRRARLMNRFLQLVREHKEALARTLTAEHGKVFADACGEEGVRFYTRRKSIMQRRPDSSEKGAEFAMPVSH